MAKSKLWGGTFAKKTAPIVERFTDSTRYEARLVPYDIQGSLAHARMLGKQGIVSRAEAAKLEAGLLKIMDLWRAGKFKLDPAFEDVHGNVEAKLKSILGEVAGKLHTGRSRNDQVALDEKLYLSGEVHWFTASVNKAIGGLLKMAQAYPDAVMPGYTHLQRAQPILFSHWCLAYVEMLFRDRRRLGFCLGSLDECPLGAAALAGSPLPLDRAFVARELGFGGVTANSLDTVSDRDYVLDFAFALSMIMAHLSRLGEDIVLYASQEFGFFKIDDSFATGSSLMPQKKNPDVAELLRGRAGRAYGLLTQLLTMVKGQPLAYNRDLQEDKELLFSTTDLVAGCLEIVPPLLKAIQIDKNRMRAACEKGFLDATDAADFLVRRGVPFRQAHEAVGIAVQYCQAKALSLAELSEAEWKQFHPRYDASVKRRLGALAPAKARDTEGGTSPSRVKQAIFKAKERLKQGF